MKRGNDILNRSDWTQTAMLNIKANRLCPPVARHQRQGFCWVCCRDRGQRLDGNTAHAAPINDETSAEAA